MNGLIGKFRRKIISTVWKGGRRRPKGKGIDDKIALGVLIWGVGVVACADGTFSPQEEKKIRQILDARAKITKRDYAIVLAAIKQAGAAKINLYRFVREMNKDLTYASKVAILEDLFRIACADKRLHNKERDVIADIAKLLHISREEFIDIKRKSMAKLTCFPHT
jgi:uncharacterized tellurite resistance protein B-like protein